MPPRGLIGDRPPTPPAAEDWVKSRATRCGAGKPVPADRYAARLSVDVSRELRSRIKIAAFRQGSTVANLLRQMLQEQFGEDTEHL